MNNRQFIGPGIGLAKKLCIRFGLCGKKKKDDVKNVNLKYHWRTWQINLVAGSLTTTWFVKIPEYTNCRTLEPGTELIFEKAVQEVDAAKDKRKKREETKSWSGQRTMPKKYVAFEQRRRVRRCDRSSDMQHAWHGAQSSALAVWANSLIAATKRPHRRAFALASVDRKLAQI